jgi:hypothetical protein
MADSRAAAMRMRALRVAGGRVEMQASRPNPSEPAPVRSRTAHRLCMPSHDTFSVSKNSTTALIWGVVTTGSVNPV